MNEKTKNASSCPQKTADRKNAKRKLVNETKFLAQYYRLNQLFRNFLELTALRFSNTTEYKYISDQQLRYRDKITVMGKRLNEAYARIKISLFQAIHQSMEAQHSVFIDLFMECGLSVEHGSASFMRQEVKVA